MNIIKTKNEDRGYKKCQCCVCKEISECTPDNDFYDTEDHGDEIVCEKCFKDYVKK